MISTRFGLILSFLLIVAAVPTVIHTYIGEFADDKLAVEAISINLAGLGSKPTDRNAAWVRDTYDSYDWIERRYSGYDDENILLFVARSYNLKRLYHHPEIGVLRGVDLLHEGAADFSGIPVHVLKSRTGTGTALYVLLYDGQFIKKPIRQQIITSIELLYGPRKPMTLFMVYDNHAGHEDIGEDLLALRVLRAAVESFMSQRDEVVK